MTGADMEITRAAPVPLAPAPNRLGRISEEAAGRCVDLDSPRAHFVDRTMLKIDGGEAKALISRLRDSRPQYRDTVCAETKPHPPPWRLERRAISTLLDEAAKSRAQLLPSLASRFW